MQHKNWLSLAIVTCLVALGAAENASAQTYYTINLQAQSGHYVVAEGGGNSFVNVDRGSAGAWETFELEDINGGSLNSGDLVRFYTSGGYYFNLPTTCDDFGKVERLVADYTTPSCKSTFWIERYDNFNNEVPGTINSGDQVALRGSNVYLASAVNGGGSTISVDRAAVGPWEKFFITIY